MAPATSCFNKIWKGRTDEIEYLQAKGISEKSSNATLGSLIPSDHRKYDKQPKKYTSHTRKLNTIYALY